MNNFCDSGNHNTYCIKLNVMDATAKQFSDTNLTNHIDIKSGINDLMLLCNYMTF